MQCAPVAPCYLFVMRRLSAIAPLGVSLLFAASVWLSAGEAEAYERQWHLGAQVGYTLAGFPNGPSSGFGGGGHLTYGVTDFMNLRVHADISGYDVPDPRPLALVYNGGAGVEFAFDVLQVVPYIGLTAGAAGVSEQDTDPYAALSLELPGGLIYYPERDFGVGFEARYRVLLFGRDDGAIHNMTAFLRLEYVWGW